MSFRLAVCCNVNNKNSNETLNHYSNVEITRVKMIIPAAPNVNITYMHTYMCVGKEEAGDDKKCAFTRLHSVLQYIPRSVN